MSSLKKSISNGIFYTALAKYSNIVVSVFITAVLARLLTPSEYGIIAIVMVFITFFTYLADFGIGPAIIQNKELENEDIESIFTVSIFIALTLAALFYLCAGAIANFYENPELMSIARWLSLSVLLSALNVVPGALNKKDLKFRELGIISVIVQVAGGILAVVLALLGFSYFSLVIRAIVTALFLFLGSYYLNPVKLKLRVRWSAITKIWRFSTYQFLFNFINYFARNTDNLFIGKYFGSAMLGFYDKAYSLMLMPVQNLTHVITPVLHPVLSDYQDRKEKIYQSFLTLSRILTMIGFPLSVFLCFSGKEIIYLFYGPQWTESIPIFQLLAVIIGLEVLLSSTGSFFQSANRADLLLLSGIITSGLIASGVLYGIFIAKSLAGVAYGVIAARILNFAFTVYLLVKKTLKSSLRRFFRELTMPFLVSLAVLLVNLLFLLFSINNIYISLFLKLSLSFVAFMLAFSSSARNRKAMSGLYAAILSRIKRFGFTKPATSRTM